MIDQKGYLDPVLIVEIKKASAKKFKRGDLNFKKAPLNQKFDFDIKKLLGLKIDTKILIKVAYIKKKCTSIIKSTNLRFTHRPLKYTQYQNFYF